MGEIILIRHGQASFGTSNYDQLSNAGFEQARMLGAYFRERDIRFDHVATGQLLRHRQTLNAMACTSVAPSVLPGLDEYDFQTLMQAHAKQFGGVPPQDITDPRAFLRQMRNSLRAWEDGSLQAPLTESWSDFEQRIQRSLAALQTPDDSQCVLAVSSGGAISMLVRAVLGLTVEQMISLNLQMANTSITRLLFKGRKVHLTSWNGVPHLDHPRSAHLITFT